jgi:hypothetical protein
MDGGAMSSRRLLLTVAVAFVIGGALKDFFSSITSGLVIPIAAPIISAIVPGVQQTGGGAEITIGSVKLEIGKVLSATGTLIASLVVVSVVLPYLKAYAPISGAKRS